METNKTPKAIPTPPPMSDKTELPKEWQKLAEIKAGCTIDTMDFGNQWAYNIAVNAAEYDFIQGAKAMRDAMEKMLKDKIEAFELLRKNTPDFFIYVKIQASAIIKEYEQLLTELTFLTPTQDEPTA